MNEQNLDFLNRQIKYTGFGEEHAAELKAKIEKGEKEFVLLHNQDFGKDQTAATLHFRKSDTSDDYFFNRYALLLKTEQYPDPIKQTFYINAKQDNITLKEAYNLLSGRSVLKEMTPKEGEKYKAWLHLDFKEINTNGQFKINQIHPNYGYDLEASLVKHPIQELNTNEGTRRLLESLERGNRQPVHYGPAGQEQKVFLEAAPKFKGLNFYDGSMKRVLSYNIVPKQALGQSQTQTPNDQNLVEGQKKGQGVKKNATKDEKQTPRKRKSQKDVQMIQAFLIRATERSPYYNCSYQHVCQFVDVMG